MSGLLALALAAGVTACAGGAARSSLSSAPIPAPAHVAPEAAAAHGPAAGSDTASANAAIVQSEDVQHEAEQLFGAAVTGSAPAASITSPRFDIDVSSYGARRRVLEYLEFFQVDARDRFEIWLSRLGRYEGMIRERLRAKGLPEDLVYLTLVESGLSNTAVSRARAVGMWQFIASTARLYGLTVDPWVDERRDPFRATEAATDFLGDLVDRLGSVYLAAAAYNAGAGRIERGVRRLPGEPDSLSDATFFELADRRYLRRETRDYVPKLIAAALIAKQPERYGFTDIPPLPPLEFDEVVVSDATGLDVLARLADTTAAAMLELNPQFVRGVTPPGREAVVRVPRGRGEMVAAGWDTLPVNDRITFVDHYVARGQTLSGIAQRYHVSVAMIRGANPALKPQALRVGQRIIIPMSGRIVPPSAWSVPSESHTTRRKAAPSGIAGSYRVRPGDTPSQIARRYGVSLRSLLDANDLEMDSIIKAGQVLKIPGRAPAVSTQ